jgi:hypothetical protein
MRRILWTIIMVATSAVVSPAAVWSAPPTLAHLFPAGGQRGTTITVTCTGTFSWPVKVWAPGLEVVANKEAGRLEVTIPKDLAADRVWLRLYNSDGASAPAPFLIDNLKEINEREPNDEPEKAQELTEPSVIVNGVLAKKADVDCFALHLTAGQTLVAAVDAHGRLGSPMDAILQVVTPDGQLLAENNDDVHLDPRLVFQPTKSGRYVIRLFAFSSTPNTDIRLSGGANFVYRLTLTTGPYVFHAVPLSVSLARPGKVELRGWNLPTKTTAPAVPFGGPKSADYQEREVLTELRLPSEAKLGFAFAPQFAGGARVRLTSHATVSALASTDAWKPMMLSVPSLVTGCLHTPRQKHAFRVPLKKGQAVVVSVESNSLNFPFDPALQFTDPAGSVVASAADVGPNREAMFAHTAAKDGDYLLTLRDRFGQGGPRFFYRMTVRPEEPDFDLSLATDGIVVLPSKTTELPIKIQRRGGPVGPITIRATGLPPGVRAPAVFSEPTGPTAAQVTMKFTTTGSVASGPIRLAGTASQPTTLVRFARTAPRLGATFDSIWLTVHDKK